MLRLVSIDTFWPWYFKTRHIDQNHTPSLSKTHSSYVEIFSHISEIKTKSDFLSKYIFGRFSVDWKRKVFALWMEDIKNMSYIKTVECGSASWCLDIHWLHIRLTPESISCQTLFSPLFAASPFHWIKVWVSHQESIYWTLWLFMRAGLWKHTVKHAQLRCCHHSCSTG